MGVVTIGVIVVAPTVVAAEAVDAREVEDPEDAVLLEPTFELVDNPRDDETELVEVNAIVAP